MTLLLRVTTHQPDPGTIARAADCLRSGGLVAFPTETVYGLGAHAWDTVAIRRIFTVKRRPTSDPLIVHIADATHLATVAAQVPSIATQLAGAFWPGPLTLVLPRAVGVPADVTAGGPTVAVRVPAHPVARALLRAAGIPVAAPSANLFSRPSPTCAEHVLHDLQGLIDIVLDGGPTTVGIESTVLDLSGPRPLVLRPGAITLEMLRPLAPDVAYAAPHTRPGALPSPGLLAKHYSPNAPLTLYEGNPAARRARMLCDIATLSGEGHRVGVLTSAADLPAFTKSGAARTVELGSENDLPAMAARLYAALRDVDAPEVTVILAPGIGSPGGLADALRDRLRRAAAGRLVSVQGR